jgi:hypothetical protein
VIGVSVKLVKHVLYFFFARKKQLISIQMDLFSVQVFSTGKESVYWEADIDRVFHLKDLKRHIGLVSNTGVSIKSSMIVNIAL